MLSSVTLLFTVQPAGCHHHQSCGASWLWL